MTGSAPTWGGSLDAPLGAHVGAPPPTRRRTCALGAHVGATPPTRCRTWGRLFRYALGAHVGAPPPTRCRTWGRCALGAHVGASFIDALLGTHGGTPLSMRRSDPTCARLFRCVAQTPRARASFDASLGPHVRTSFDASLGSGSFDALLSSHVGALLFDASLGSGSFDALLSSHVGALLLHVARTPWCASTSAPSAPRACACTDPPLGPTWARLHAPPGPTWVRLHRRTARPHLGASPPAHRSAPTWARLHRRVARPHVGAPPPTRHSAPTWAPLHRRATRPTWARLLRRATRTPRAGVHGIPMELPRVHALPPEPRSYARAAAALRGRAASASSSAACALAFDVAWPPSMRASSSLRAAAPSLRTWVSVRPSISVFSTWKC